jgi:hypothetical protein
MRRGSLNLLMLAAALALWLLPGAARGQVLLTPEITWDGSLYHYHYTLTNNTLSDLSLITIQTVAGADVALNPGAPDGFQLIYDSGNGLLSFAPADPDNGGTMFEAGQAYSGFHFQSPLRPGWARFSALDVNGLKAFSGVASAPVPEPGSLAMLGALTVTGLIWWRRRSRLRDRFS